MLKRSVVYFGSSSPLPEARPLRAGPLTLSYANGELRGIRWGSRQVVQRIYMAVRDRDWRTVPNDISDEHVDAGKDRFRITYRAENRQDNIHFSWGAIITGADDGTITFSFEGHAVTDFLQSRIGLCILHPMTECCGRTCRIHRAGGASVAGVFPRYIDPSVPVDPFIDMTGMSYEVLPGVDLTLQFAGDLFEIEDQRNWTDASYKTFSTPSRLGYPRPMAIGTQVAQSVTLQLSGERKAAVSAIPETAVDCKIDVDAESATPLIPIGLGSASHGEELSVLEIARLQSLNLSHIRVDVTPSEPGWQSAFRRNTRVAKAISVPLEIALHLSSAVDADLTRVVEEITVQKPDVCRWLVFHSEELVPNGKWVRLARAVLHDCTPDVSVGSGSDAGFFELNNERSVTADSDFLAYPLSPQMHAFDNASLVETLPAQAVTVESARQFAGSRPIIISPITFKMRFNPYATSREMNGPGALPPQVDPRQMSLFGAGWTLGSIKYLVECGQVSSLTYYETSGWRGVMDTASGSPLPDQFPALAGMVFPIYHVLAAIREFAGGESVRAISHAPSVVEAIALRKETQFRMMLANYTPERRRVLVEGVPGRMLCKFLDEATFAGALQAPEKFRGTSGNLLASNEICMPPFAIAILDVALPEVSSGLSRDEESVRHALQGRIIQ